MSYSRWKDEAFWPSFRDALRQQHPSLTEEGLQKAKDFNAQRYHFQGIGRYAPAAAYARGIADLEVLANLVASNDYVFGQSPTSVDACIYPKSGSWGTALSGRIGGICRYGDTKTGHR